MAYKQDRAVLATDIAISQAFLLMKTTDIDIVQTSGHCGPDGTAIELMRRANDQSADKFFVCLSNPSLAARIRREMAVKSRRNRYVQPDGRPGNSRTKEFAARYRRALRHESTLAVKQSGCWRFRRVATDFVGYGG
jgi:hypothetical protein